MANFATIAAIAGTGTIFAVNAPVSYTHLDVYKRQEITRGEARVIPTSQVQIVQSVDGGVVEALLVKEGQIVDAGQLLLRVDPTRFVSNMLESRAGQMALQAKSLRLMALTRGTPFNPPADLMREAPDVVAQEMRLYESRKAEILSLIHI